MSLKHQDGASLGNLINQVYKTVLGACFSDGLDETNYSDIVRGQIEFVGLRGDRLWL
ncbi:hypothetical protein Lepto7375DRAFT_3031 [Leptolyngbya sp. PCC 7375]|nr:hypothetical protein Lepto7375DRAFT_3031 [Leptolyngbya sp. PCC 7375]